MKLFILATVIYLLSVGCYAINFQKRCTRLNNAGIIVTNQCSLFGEDQYCDVDSETCVEKRKIKLDNEEVFTDVTQEICEDGFRTGGVNTKCVKVATLGCVVDSDLAGSLITCQNFGVFQNQGDDRVCVRQNGFNGRNFQIAAHASRCEYLDGNDANTRRACGNNLVCSSNNICQRRGDVGASCGTPFTACLNGLVCDEQNKRCIRSFSLRNGQPCPSASSEWDGCASGYCGPSGHCASTATARACYRNVDCAVDGVSPQRSVCFNVQENGPGRCSGMFYKAKADWHSCIYRQCSGHFREGSVNNDFERCMTVGRFNDEGERVRDQCMKEYARYKCSEYCPRQKDRRIAILQTSNEGFVERGSMPFKFDCEELTVTRFTSSDCEITNQFENCDAIMSYPSPASISKLSPIIALVAIFITLFL